MCTITSFFVFALFPFVNKAIEIFVETDPPDREVTWDGLGPRKRIQNNGHEVTTSYDTPGPKTLIARCNDDEVSKTIRIKPLPPDPPPVEIGTLGQQEHVPDLTYISRLEPDNDSFLEEAVNFHREWGLRPRRVSSLQQIVNHLANGPSSALRRIRIVGHGSAEGIGLTLFNQSAAGVREDELREFAKSDAHGLSLLIGRAQNVSLRRFLPPLLELMRRDDDEGLLARFGLADDDPNSFALEELLVRNIELALMIPENIPNQDQIPVQNPEREVARALQVLIDLLAESVRIETSQTSLRVEKLVQAIENGVNELIISDTFNLPEDPFYYKNLKASVRAIRNGFRDKLNRARRRFRKTTFIDIRGCRTGQNSLFLSAVARFFASNAERQPRVSAPDFFQVFGRPASIFLDHDMIDNFPEFANRPEVQAAVEHWAEITRIPQNLRDENWDDLEPRLRLHRYLDLAGVLPIPGNTTTETKDTTLLMMDFSGTEKGMTRWVESQWTPLNRVRNRAQSLKNRWWNHGNFGQPPPFTGVAESGIDVPDDESFISPDTRFVQHIINDPI